LKGLRVNADARDVVMGTGNRDLPSGTVTMLFTDVEGSTRLLRELGASRYAEELMTHRERIRAAADAHCGVELGTEGDAFFFVFQSAGDCLAASTEMQRVLADGPLRVRMGIHSGEVLLVEGDYVGMAVHKAARISSVAHGGQIVVSAQTRALVDVSQRDLGEHRLKDLTVPERLYQLGDGEFPPLHTLRHVHLPVQATPLLGRERELAELLELSETHRLVTLTGTGGSGKTRLSLAPSVRVVVVAARVKQLQGAAAVWNLQAMGETVTVEHPNYEIEGGLSTCLRRRAMRQCSPSSATPLISTGRLENACTPSSEKPRRRWNRSCAGGCRFM
jgi:class 3 adenylate cyclase